MKKSYIILIICLGIFACKPSENQSEKLQLSKSLIDSLEVDAYGMKSYVMVMLTSGDNDNLTASEKRRLQQEHLENIQKLAREGHLILAGPFVNDTTYRGIYVFNTSSIDTAKSYTISDPAIKAGLFGVNYKQWYASGSLPLINKLHEQLQTKSITE